MVSLSDILRPWLTERNWTNDYYSLILAEGPSGFMGLHGAMLTAAQGHSWESWYKRGGHHLLVKEDCVETCNGTIFKAVSPTFLADLDFEMNNCHI